MVLNGQATKEKGSMPETPNTYLNALRIFHEVFRDQNADRNYKSTGDLLDPDRSVIKYPYTFGVEVECVLSKDSLLNVIYNKENFERLKKIAPNWKVSSDISVGRSRDGDYPCEIKSQIFFGTTGAKNLFDLWDVLSPKFNPTCGQHVHLGMTKISSEGTMPASRVAPLRYSLSEFFDEWCLSLAVVSSFMSSFVISRHIDEKRAQRGNWARMLFSEMPHTVSELYFDPNYDGRRNVATRMARWMRDHYAGVSFSEKGTVEFRFLQGQSDLQFLLKMINLYMSILDLTDRVNWFSAVEIMNNILSRSGAIAKFNSRDKMAHFISRAHLPLPDGCEEEGRIRADIRRRLISLLNHPSIPKKAQAKGV